MHAQVHVQHAGKSSMLLNTDSLPGTTQQALRLAEREAQLSNAHPATSRQVERNVTMTT